MDLLTLKEIRRAMQNGAAPARVHVQVENAAPKLTREQQPYCELTLTDACDRMTLRVWSDHPAYKTCSALTNQDFIELTAEFFQSQYGLQGPADLRAKQTSDFEFVRQTVAGISDPRLAALGEAFLSEWGDRFRRTAAARNYHHARRGGLVEHTAQMMRVARQIAPLYAELNLDLLLAGILFHDSGKLWENALPENGFVMNYDELGELMGHISIGLELVNALWRRLSVENTDAWKNLTPASEDVRIHLLHLIGAHHGELNFGSPVAPKTPEAMALHYIDNLDARLEMFAAGYTRARPLAARIFDRVRPLPGNLVKSLEKFQQAASPRPPGGKLL